MKKVYLIGRSGAHANEKFLLEGELIIGRDPQMCQLVYPANEKNISGVHCKIQEIDGNICLIDLRSTNGTYFQDGTRLAPDMPRTMVSGQGFYLSNRENFFDLLIEEEAEVNQKRKWTRQQAAQSAPPQMMSAEPVPVSAPAPVVVKKNSATSGVLALLLIIAVAVAGVLGYSYYQESNKSAFEKGFEDFMDGDSFYDSITNLFK